MVKDCSLSIGAGEVHPAWIIKTGNGQPWGRVRR